MSVAVSAFQAGPAHGSTLTARPVRVKGSGFRGLGLGWRVEGPGPPSQSPASQVLNTAPHCMHSLEASARRNYTPTPQPFRQVSNTFIYRLHGMT